MAQLTGDEAIDVEHVDLHAAGRPRTMTLVRRRDLCPGAPAVLVFHGSNQDGNRIRRFAFNSLDRFAERSGAVVAYLDGYEKGWNDARLSSPFAARRDGVDDVAFTLAVADHLAARYRVDKSRVYVVGYTEVWPASSDSGPEVWACPPWRPPPTTPPATASPPHRQFTGSRPPPPTTRPTSNGPTTGTWAGRP